MQRILTLEGENDSHVASRRHVAPPSSERATVPPAPLTSMPSGSPGSTTMVEAVTRRWRGMSPIDVAAQPDIGP